MSDGDQPEHAEPTPPPRRRGRRATGGAPAADPDPVLPRRSPDDTDEGWGEQPGGNDDERLLRDVPPHW